MEYYMQYNSLHTNFRKNAWDLDIYGPLVDYTCYLCAINVHYMGWTNNLYAYFVKHSYSRNFFTIYDVEKFPFSKLIEELIVDGDWTVCQMATDDWQSMIDPSWLSCVARYLIVDSVNYTQQYLAKYWQIIFIDLSNSFLSAIYNISLWSLSEE